MTEPFVAIDAVSSFTGLAKGTIYHRIKELPHYKLGGRLRFRLSEIAARAESQKVEPMNFEPRIRARR